MAILHFRSIERRRTARATMCINVLAFGENEAGEKFKFWTRTVSVSEYGGVMEVQNSMSNGQEFYLMNEFNSKKARARVVFLKTLKEGKMQAAFEFVEGGEKFWSMVFPAAGAKALRRLQRAANQG